MPSLKSAFIVKSTIGVNTDTDVATLSDNKLSIAGIQAHSNSISANVTIETGQNAVVGGPYVVDATLTISGNLTVA